jgi:hypothetical protein
VTNLDVEIFQRYYEGAKRDGVVWTLYDYCERKGYVEDEDEDYWAHPEIAAHGRAIQDVLTLEIGIYVFRRLNGPWGEVIDNLVSQRTRKINEYREQTGFEIDTGNDEAMW